MFLICSCLCLEAGIYDRIQALNKQYGLDIETVEINGRMYPQGAIGRGQTLEESAAICDRVAGSGAHHLALMGYMKMVRGDLIDEYGWLPHFTSVYEARMSNTHPGPIPETEDTYGINASARVLELGLKMSKHTVHLVAAGIDRGPKLAEHPVQVLPDDSPEEVFDRVQTVEKAVLPYVLDRFLKQQEAYIHGNS